jgi:hypothetical protein
MLESMFMTFAPGVQVERLPPNFQMREADRQTVLATLAQADLIFAQRVSAGFQLPWLTPASLKQAFGGIVWIWPNIYFDGYTPGVEYLYLANWGKLSSPLEDYHLREVAEAYRAGASPKEAAQRLIASAAGPLDPFVASLAELRKRELETDIPISDWLAQEVSEHRCFYTPNHPYNKILAEMGRRLAAAGDIPFDATQAAESFAARLDRIYIPALPAVVRRHALRFDHVPLYRGLEVTDVAPGNITLGAPRCYDLATLIDRFYRIYDVALTSGCSAAPLEPAHA